MLHSQPLIFVLDSLFSAERAAPKSLILHKTVPVVYCVKSY